MKNLFATFIKVIAKQRCNLTRPKEYFKNSSTKRERMIVQREARETVSVVATSWEQNEKNWKRVNELENMKMSKTRRFMRCIGNKLSTRKERNWKKEIVLMNIKMFKTRSFFLRCL